MKKPVKTGLDVLVEQGFAPLAGARVGVVAHAASVDCKLRHVVDLLHGRKEFSLVRIFAPEHGFRGAAQDMVSVEDAYDARTNLPVVSLYGNSFESLIPKIGSLDDLDILVVDLQDVGSRYYTYTQTLALCMEACGKCGVKVIVLDRPNPINGIDIEGALLTAGCRSFCGMHPVANRHGLTMGEFARLILAGFGEGENRTPGISCQLQVIELQGWKRKMYFGDTGLPWIFPSPNMPTVETALVYPGACLFEATNLSEGRGTTKPFELIGGPYVDGTLWAEETLLTGLSLPGTGLRPVGFLPQFQKWQQKVCSGVQIHITDRSTFKPFRLGLALIATAARLFPEFSWRRQSYEFIDNVPAIDLLYGNLNFRKAVETKAPLSSLLPELERFEAWYTEARKEFLIYN